MANDAPAVPQTSTLITSPATVVWSDGSKFDGYVWIGVELPATPVGFTSPYLWSTQRLQKLPKYIKVPVINGVIDNGTSLFYTTNLNPPACLYVAYWYSQFGVLIAPSLGTATPFTVTTDQTTLTVPTLTVPSGPTPVQPS